MNDLHSLRKKIDDIDGRIVKLLLERFIVVNDIAEYKKEHGLEVLQKSREAEVLKNIADKIDTAEYREYILKIYAEILETSKLSQNKKP